MEPITVGSVLGGAAKMVGMGFLLSIGFWAGKKLTDQIDVFIATHSPEFKALVAGMIAKEQTDERTKEETTTETETLPNPGRL
jgi:hypothetical protein